MTRSLRVASVGLLLATALVHAPPVRAGGGSVDVALGQGRLWFAGDGIVRSFDASDGRPVRAPALGPAAYPLSVATSAPAVWVASVESGFVDGRLFRIDARSGRVRAVWHVPQGSLQLVTAGAGSVWALIGSPHGARVARFGLDGTLQRVWAIGAAGRIAADAAGCWVSTQRWLLRIAPDGVVHRVLRAPLGDVTTGDGAAWLPRATSVLRIDDHSGRIRTLLTGPQALGGYQHDLGVAGGVLWAIRRPRGAPLRSVVVRIDARTGRTTGSRALGDVASSLVVAPGAVWVAATATERTGTGSTVIRLDPRTLRTTRVLRLP